MKGLHHIALWAPDEEGFRQALAFYNKILGCPVVRTWVRKGQSAAMLELGGTLLELVIDPAGEDGPFAHIAFDVEDVDAVVEHRRAAHYHGAYRRIPGPRLPRPGGLLQRPCGRVCGIFPGALTGFL